MTGSSTAPCVLTRKTSKKLYFRCESKMQKLPLVIPSRNVSLSPGQGSAKCIFLWANEYVLAKVLNRALSGLGELTLRPSGLLSYG